MYQVKATITTLPTKHGGLADWLPSGTSALQVTVHDPVFGRLVFDCVVNRSEGSGVGPSLLRIPVVLTFPEDRARIHLLAGVRFELYLGRVVGSGEIHQTEG